NLRKVSSARLLDGLHGDFSPAFGSFHGGGGKMRFGPAGNDRNDSCHAEFYALFDRPFHAVKFEDREKQGQIQNPSSIEHVSEFKFHPFGRYIDDAALAHTGDGRNIELLSELGSKDFDQMSCVRADQRSAVAGDLIGDPAAARHAIN